MRERILEEIYHTKVIHGPNTPIGNVMGIDTDKWYIYHKEQGHHMDDCHHLKQEI